MTALMKIQSFIQAYVKAIASILDVDVTIVDNELVRVAGTGIYADEIGKTVTHANFFHHILVSGESGSITDSMADLNCKGCEKRTTCRELANVAYPIFKEGAVVGIISIIAFSEGERKNLLENRGQMEEFLKYMSVLLESKLYTDEVKERLEQQLQVVHDAEKGWSFVGDSPKMKEAIRIGKKVAKSNSTVFLRGESGTGKEIMAKMIHALSDRRDKLMISINCAAIPENLVESELFGYEEGAFTGAKKHGSIGKFELAHGSTIFLDEIGDMPFDMQVKLLRVLQSGEIQRVGGLRTVPVDLRIISATNKDLKQAIAQHQFRADLYYRISTLSILVPPLRERAEDILPLAEHFIHRHELRLNRHPVPLPQETAEAILRYPWPGNIRQLESAVERAVHLAEGGALLPEHFGIADLMENRRPAAPAPAQATLENIERQAIAAALVRFGGNISQTAFALGVSRPTLYRKMSKYGLEE